MTVDPGGLAAGNYAADDALVVPAATGASHPGPHIVTVTPTIQSGTVVRWFTSERLAGRCEPVVSASRDRVIVTRAECIDDADSLGLTVLIETAMRAMWALRDAGPDAVQGLATHTSRFPTGELLPIHRETEEAHRG